MNLSASGSDVAAKAWLPAATTRGRLVFCVVSDLIIVGVLPFGLEVVWKSTTFMLYVCRVGATLSPCGLCGSVRLAWYMASFLISSVVSSGCLFTSRQTAAARWAQFALGLFSCFSSFRVLLLRGPRGGPFRLDLVLGFVLVMSGLVLLRWYWLLGLYLCSWCVSGFCATVVDAGCHFLLGSPWL